jgi:hypothetical protein
VARRPALSGVKQSFVASHHSAENLATAVAPFLVRNYDSFHTNALHANQARRVLALSFLAVASAWEEYVGSVFVRYVAGAKSPSGYAPTLLMGPAPSLDHAFKLVAGKYDYDPDSRYLSWGPTDTIARAKLFFRGGSAFENAMASATPPLKEIALIRNRVAHASQKCRVDFIRLARRLRGGHLPQGYSVGDLLLEEPAAAIHPHIPIGDTYFRAYLRLLWWLADAIAP